MAAEVCEECGTRCAVGVQRCPQCSSTRLVPEEALVGLMPSLTVACVNEQCPAKGVERRVGLPQVVPGLLALPRLVCARCGFEPIRVTEDIVPKITVHGGATNAAADAEAEAAQDEGGEQPSPADTTSSTSSEKESSSPEPSEKQGPSRARTTGSRSKTGQTGTSSARSTGGGRETGTSGTSSADK